MHHIMYQNMLCRINLLPVELFFFLLFGKFIYIMYSVSKYVGTESIFLAVELLKMPMISCEHFWRSGVVVFILWEVYITCNTNSNSVSKYVGTESVFLPVELLEKPKCQVCWCAVVYRYMGNRTGFSASHASLNLF